MNSFAEYFKNLVLSPRLEEVYHKFLLMRHKCKYSVFVEGSLDKKFYWNYLHQRLNCKFKGDIYPMICDGKQGVIHICNYLYEHKYLNNKTRNVLNIVDRDFNVLRSHDCKLEDKISITKYYSLESYAFTENNIEIILNLLKISTPNKDIFYSNLKEYIKLILDYESLLNYCVFEKHDIISTNLFDDTCLVFSNKIVLDDSFNNKIQTIISSFSQNNYHKFDDIRNKLSNNYLLYRGHDLEKFFDFMMTHFGINTTLSELLSKEEVIRSINIDLELK